MSDIETCEDETCEECGNTINCNRENIFILTKGEEEKLWCQGCFEDLWREAVDDGWSSDDIESHLEEASEAEASEAEASEAEAPEE